MFNKNVQKEKGFSMIEVMMATFLVSVGLVAVISLLSAGLRQSTLNKNNLIASFLAQEGVELVRNVRDTNWVNGEESFGGISNGNDCRAQADAENSNNLSCGVSDFQLYFDSVYEHSGSSSQETRFSRKIIIEDEAGGEQKIVTSIAIWGKDFPDNPVDLDNCNSASQCAFSKISLTKWKEE